MQRTLSLETRDKIGQDVKLYGWINTRRDHGKIMFLDLRDRTGLVQVVATKKLSDARPEDVVEIAGTVKKRPESMINPKLATGIIEVEAKEIKVLNKAKEMPFPLDTEGYDIGEEVRLKYRYLDLRRPRLNRNIRIRSQYVQAAREYLFSQDFVEIETPLLTKSTPEGSRDFIVPSRMYQGKFFALPQSPQQYKQLLMTAGFERYFQIARCLRDEDPRADRGFEHTQIDIEMSFVEREDVMKLVEEMTIYALEKIGANIVLKPFPIITYQEAFKKYGADKFDLRTEEQKQAGMMAFAWVVDFPFFEKDKEGNWTFTHNPFSKPIPEHEAWLAKKEHIGEILTSQYDLVCNGFEVAGGSVRSHKPEILEKVFEIMGYQKAEIKAKFGHMLEAFEFGTPPHCGCAQGFERLLMAYFGESYIREVQAFPQTGSGRTSIMDSPSEIEPEQLRELGLTVLGNKTDQDVYQKIIAMLKDSGITYEAYKHQAVFTSDEAAKVRGTKLHQGTKALVMYADKKPIMTVLPADLKLDLKLFKRLYGVKDLRMATTEEVKKVTGVEIGAVPPFGHIFGITLYLDLKLRENTEVVFNAGSHTRSIQLKEADYEKVAQPTIGEFSAP